MKIYKIIGLMSGTSLDGVDIAYCQFFREQRNWNYKIITATTVPYDAKWKKKLSDSIFCKGFELLKIHKEYGKLLGNRINEFVSKNKIPVDFIASHGHTVFHQPVKGLTLQIGDGSEIAAVTGIPVVCDFRSGDVALGGQGAPLVPIGDRILFKEFDFCLNLGGFANISFEWRNERIAFDISPFNILLNRFAAFKDKPFDKDGRFASKGCVHNDLFSELNKLKFYFQKPPKSLGREWVEKIMLPVFVKYKISPEDVLCTLCEHFAFQISAAMNSMQQGKVLVTGGGAYNKYFISRLKKHTSHKVVIPDKITVDNKEALIFALLGLLRMLGKNNCLASVTGASRDHSSGAVYLP